MRDNINTREKGDIDTKERKGEIHEEQGNYGGGKQIRKGKGRESNRG